MKKSNNFHNWIPQKSILGAFVEVRVTVNMFSTKKTSKRLNLRNMNDLKGNFAIFCMLAKYVPGDIKYIFTKLYRHISTNNEANRKFVILISNFYMGCDVLAR